MGSTSYVCLFFFFPLAVPGIEPRVLYMQHSTKELQFQPHLKVFIGPSDETCRTFLADDEWLSLLLPLPLLLLLQLLILRSVELEGSGEVSEEDSGKNTWLEREQM